MNFIMIYKLKMYTTQAVFKNKVHNVHKKAKFFKS